MKNLFTLLFLSLASFVSLADVAVIVHPSNSELLDHKQIIKLFLAKEKTFANGGKVIPVNQDSKTAMRQDFDSKVLNKSASQVTVYWSILMFTGKGQPPKEVASDAEVIALVSEDVNTIGYIDSANVNDTVKVVATF